MALTNEEFGTSVGITHSMASRIRHGVRLPSVRVIRNISRAYDIPLSDLIDAHTEGGEAFARLLDDRIFSVVAA